MSKDKELSFFNLISVVLEEDKVKVKDATIRSIIGVFNQSVKEFVDEEMEKKYADGIKSREIRLTHIENELSETEKELERVLQEKEGLENMITAQQKKLNEMSRFIYQKTSRQTAQDMISIFNSLCLCAASEPSFKIDKDIDKLWTRARIMSYSLKSKQKTE